jgi:hypothetical protein
VKGTASSGVKSPSPKEPFPSQPSGPVVTAQCVSLNLRGSRFHWGDDRPEVSVTPFDMLTLLSWRFIRARAIQRPGASRLHGKLRSRSVGIGHAQPVLCGTRGAVPSALLGAYLQP